MMELADVPVILRYFNFTLSIGIKILKKAFILVRW